MRKLSGLLWLMLILLVLTETLAGCANSGVAAVPARIGVLTIGDSRMIKVQGLQKGLQELGLTGAEVAFEIFNAKDDQKKLAEEALKLVQGLPDVIVVTGVVEAEALMEKLAGSKPIPVVMIGVTSPKDLQLIKGYEELGIPVTGVANGHVELTGKRMELLYLLFPQRSHILLLYDPRLRASVLALERARQSVQDSYSIEPIPISNDQDLESFRRRSFSARDSILVLPSYFLEARFREIRDISLQKRVPVMGLYESETEAGFTASYGLSYFDQGYQAARLVIRMLKGEAAGIPFEVPDSVQLKINVQAADYIGESVSPVGLSYGEKVYTIKE
ncbi:MAG: ABC transporter substrate-binding protein [Desulfitobacteriaceae bacterium]